jgi:2-hydroxy-3-keto-5-methylthiopentenyl-1-phosphate phosphatase
MGYETLIMKWNSFEKKKDFVVCVDSDGCAMDTMNIKHIRCFGPCMIKEWHLEKWQDAILESWNRVNLYTVTRGINRFKGLAIALKEVNEKYTHIEGIKEFSDWAEKADELSNNSVEKMITENEIFAKALSWSIAVNEEIEALPEDDIKPFEGVKEALLEIHKHCDVVVVSSANPEAVKAEWKRFGLLGSVDLLCTQDMGSKAYCIGRVADKGYDKKKIIMCGDAVGDLDAANSNGVLFYPICVNHEEASWADFVPNVLPKFLDGSYDGAYQEKVKKDFLDNLK